MSKNFIEAAVLQLKGKGIEHLAAIENILTNPAGVADHTGHVGDIMEHARKAAECDEAVSILKKYFVARPAPPQPMPMPQPPMPVPATGGPVLPERSPTMRKAMAAQPPQPKPKPAPKRRSRKKKED